MIAPHAEDLDNSDGYDSEKWRHATRAGRAQLYLISSIQGQYSPKMLTSNWPVLTGKCIWKVEGYATRSQDI